MDCAKVHRIEKTHSQIEYTCIVSAQASEEIRRSVGRKVNFTRIELAALAFPGFDAYEEFLIYIFVTLTLQEDAR